MNPDAAQHELLVRYLDGRVTPEERQRVAELLRSDAAARDFVRAISEQAVMVADLERIAASREEALHSRPAREADQERKIVRAGFKAWPWRAIAAAMVTLLAVLGLQLLKAAKPGVARVSKVTGSGQLFGFKGRTEQPLIAGTVLAAGDTLETLSCDAWIELKLTDDSTLTIAGQSILRILDAEAGKMRFKLLEGALWGSAAPGRPSESLLIQTPTLTAEMTGTQFDIRTSSSETFVRVNEGSARVRQDLDESEARVAKGQQATASLSRKEPLSAMAQPDPVNYWACDLGKVPEVILGKWLPPAGKERARLGADPLLWPIPGREPLMLYAVALAAWKSSDRPVLLHADSRLRFRGRTDRAQTVRFGFSAQKMRGVFAGKFELDVSPGLLAPAGETFEVELRLKDFRPLHPQLAPSPEGLELTDVYALTINEDAGLEINHIELAPTNR